jgi:hypothetical protein
MLKREHIFYKINNSEDHKQLFKNGVGAMYIIFSPYFL